MLLIGWVERYTKFGASFNPTQNIKEVLLVVDLDMCDSCKGVLKQFKAKYPDIDIRIAQKKPKK